MSWHIIANSETIGFRIDKDGQESILFDALSHTCHSASDEFEIDNELNILELNIEIHPSTSNSPASLLDNIGLPSNQKIAQKISDPDRNSEGFIFYSSYSSNCLSVTIILSPDTFTNVKDMAQNCTFKKTHNLYISVSFLCFRKISADTDTPTFEEFKQGNCYYFQEASFALIHRE